MDSKKNEAKRNFGADLGEMVITPKDQRFGVGENGEMKNCC